MPDRANPIFTDNPGALPASYRVPSGLDLDLSSVFAIIDGSAAAGSFLPCLTLLTQDGHIVARVKQDDTYAAGDTGDATWSPFLRTAGSAAPPPSASVVESVSFTKSAFAISGGGFDEIDFPNRVNNSSSGIYIDRDGSNHVQLLDQGFYLLHLKGDTFPAAAAGTSTNAQLSFDVTSGTVWGWSSKGPGMALEGDARWALVIEDNNANGIDAQGAIDLLAMVWLRPTDTFPVTVSCYTTFQVNGVDTAGTANFKITVARLGDIYH